MNKMTTLLKMSCLIFILFLSSCVAEADRALVESIHRHWQTWKSHNIQSYRYEFQRSCFCLPEVTQKVTIEVSNGQIVSIVNSATQTPVTTQYADLFLTVDDLFQTIARAVAERPSRITISYDKQYGYPTEFYLDPVELHADDEYWIATGNLVPL